MTLLGIVLVLLSSCCHATWNLLSKSDGDPISFLLRALYYSALVYFPLFAVGQFYVEYSRVYVCCVVSSGFLTGLYFFTLGKAYFHGHMSVAYPIARTFPILVVTWAGLFFDTVPSAQGFAGIGLIVGGCFLLPMRKFAAGPDGFSLGNFRNWSCFWAVITALLTSLFSVIDKFAASEVTYSSAGVGFASKINYVYIQNAVAWLTVMLVTKLTRLPLKAHIKKRRAIPAGAIFLVSYSLIVIALTSDPVAYVVSFRQMSIVITAVLSMIYIERDFSLPRLVGIVVIFAGVVLVGLS